VSKIGLASASLIAAIPGAVLTVLLVMTFLKNSENLSGMMWAVSVPTLLTSVLVAVLPGAVMLFGPKADAADKAKKDDDDFGDDDEMLDDAGSDAELDEFGDDEDLVAGEGDELTMEGDDEFDDDASETIDANSDDLFMEEDDDFGLELEDEDEEDD
jgi:hypothetical protein